MLFLKLFNESLQFALHAMRVNKLRTFLSLLGVSIGIFAIIAVFTFVDALQKSISDSIKSLGDNTLYIQKWPWTFTDPNYAWWNYYKRPLPNLKEVEELKLRTTNFKAFVFQAVSNDQTIKYKSYNIEGCALVFASHDFNLVSAFELTNGRYFTDIESDAGRAVCIIGHDIAQQLFPFTDPIEKQITARGRKLTIIGVFKKTGENAMGDNYDNLVLAPINFGRNIVDLKSERVQPFIYAKGKDGTTNDELVEELRLAMRSVRRLRPLDDDNFALNESKMLIQSVTGIFDVLNITGWIIGGFSILVGGFGIANILFVSVKERTNLIGIQKSLGAKNYFILLQFLFEGVLLCLLGGTIGLLLVYGGTELLKSADVLPFPVDLTLANIVLAITISIQIGIISGFIPAYTASQLDPVEAIRSS
ncbi:MAG: ABC transporter permease [Bacteroidia bacterium]